MNWTHTSETKGSVTHKRPRLMNEEAKNLSPGVPNSCQLNGGSFVTVALSSAVSSLLSNFQRCFVIGLLRDNHGVGSYNAWPYFFALDQSV